MFKHGWMSGKQWRPWSDATYCGIWSGSTLFAQACLSLCLGLLWYDTYLLYLSRKCLTCLTLQFSSVTNHKHKYFYHIKHKLFVSSCSSLLPMTSLMQAKNFSRQHFEIFFLFFPENRLFSGGKKKEKHDQFFDLQIEWKVNIWM